MQDFVPQNFDGLSMVRGQVYTVRFRTLQTLIALHTNTLSSLACFTWRTLNILCHHPQAVSFDCCIFHLLSGFVILYRYDVLGGSGQRR